MNRSKDAPTYARETNAVKRGGVWSLVVAFVASLVAASGVGSTIFLWRNPEIWNDAREQTTFRVRSRSMEPTFRGPRQRWRCPNCDARFDVSIDDEEEKSPSASFDPCRAAFESPSARRALDTGRFFACPCCGFGQATPVVGKDGLFDGDLARALVDASESSEKLDVFGKIKRAIRKEFGRASHKNESEPLANTLRRWDVVVFRDKQERPILKRVVGLEGERVAIVNGDVVIDGKIPRRSWKQILETRVPLDSVELRSESRVVVARQVAVFEDGQTTRKSVPISNESPFPNRGGRNVAPVELARDFLLAFDWFTGDGLPVRFTALARRPTKAFLLEYDESAQKVSLRSTPLFQGKTSDGRAFEELDRADFVDASATSVSLVPSESLNRSFGRDVVFLALVDGELIVTINGEERARFSTDDADVATRPGVAAPFVILGDVERAGDCRLYRDLHYSNVDETRMSKENVPNDERVATLVGEETIIGQRRLFVLGDNSPASVDSRFPNFGTIDVDDVFCRVAPPFRSEISIDDVNEETDDRN